MPPLKQVPRLVDLSMEMLSVVMADMCVTLSTPRWLFSLQDDYYKEDSGSKHAHEPQQEGKDLQRILTKKKRNKEKIQTRRMAKARTKGAKKEGWDYSDTVNSDYVFLREDQRTALLAPHEKACNPTGDLRKIFESCKISMCTQFDAPGSWSERQAIFRKYVGLVHITWVQKTGSLGRIVHQILIDRVKLYIGKKLSTPLLNTLFRQTFFHLLIFSHQKPVNKEGDLHLSIVRCVYSCFLDIMLTEDITDLDFSTIGSYSVDWKCNDCQFPHCPRRKVFTHGLHIPSNTECIMNVDRRIDPREFLSSVHKYPIHNLTRLHLGLSVKDPELVWCIGIHLPKLRHLTFGFSNMYPSTLKALDAFYSLVGERRPQYKGQPKGCPLLETLELPRVFRSSKNPDVISLVAKFLSFMPELEELTQTPVIAAIDRFLETTDWSQGLPPPLRLRRLHDKSNWWRELDFKAFNPVFRIKSRSPEVWRHLLPKVTEVAVVSLHQTVSEVAGALSLRRIHLSDLKGRYSSRFTLVTKNFENLVELSLSGDAITKQAIATCFADMTRHAPKLQKFSLSHCTLDLTECDYDTDASFIYMTHLSMKDVRVENIYDTIKVVKLCPNLLQFVLYINHTDESDRNFLKRWLKDMIECTPKLEVLDIRFSNNVGTILVPISAFMGVISACPNLKQLGSLSYCEDPEKWHKKFTKYVANRNYDLRIQGGH